MQSTCGDYPSTFFGANLIVLAQDLIEPMAIFIWRFVQLFTDVFHHPQIFLPFAFVVMLRLLYGLLIRTTNLLAARLRFFKPPMNRLVFLHQSGMLVLG